MEAGTPEKTKPEPSKGYRDHSNTSLGAVRSSSHALRCKSEMGALHQITEHRRFDHAELTMSASRDLAAAPEGQLSPSLLDRLDGVAAMLARSYPQVGPFRLMAPVAKLLGETARRARSARAHERERLVRVLAHLGVLAGHASFDLGQPTYVDGYFSAALGAIGELGERDMRVWALGSWSVVPVNSRAPARAAELLDSAVQLARWGASQSRLSWVLALRARALASLGEQRQALALLGDAYEALIEVLPHPEERSPTDFFDVARLDAMAGACLLQLGRHSDASEALARALAARPASDRKGRSLALLELAAARVRQDEPDEACRTVAEALAVDSDALVAPVVRRARQVVGSLQLHSSRQAVVDVRQVLEQTIARGAGHE
jgi:tetratricopeptide (TPR) repeat protein